MVQPPLAFPAQQLMGEAGIGPVLGEVASPARADLVRHNAAGSETGGQHSAATVQVIECGDVAFGQIGYMDVVTPAGAVRRGVIVTPDIEIVATTDSHLRHKRHGIVGCALRVFTDQAGFMCADGVEIAQTGNTPIVGEFGD